MKLAVFDIDGTLTATNGVDSICFEKALKTILQLDEIETDWSCYRYVTDSGITDEVSQRYRGTTVSEGEVRAIEEYFLNELESCSIDSFLPIPGADAFLRCLRKLDDVAVAMATGAWRRSAMLKLNRAGIDVSNIPLASSSDAFEREAIMRIARDKVGTERKCTEFDEIVYFGDAVWDVNPSRNLNWRLIGIGEHHEPLKKMGVENTFGDYGDQSAVLAALLNRKL